MYLTSSIQTPKQKIIKQQIIRTTVKDQIDGRNWHKLALIDQNQ